MKPKMWTFCCLVLGAATIAGAGRITPSSEADLEIDIPEIIELASDSEEAFQKYKDLKAKLLQLKPEYVSDEDDDEASHQERHLRTLFPAGYTGCSCSDLAAIAAQITVFEEEVKGIDDLENKIGLIATAIKQLGLWVESGVKGPQGPPGTQGSPGVTGPQGDPGDTGSDTTMTREGVPGPQGPSGPTGVRGTKGPRGDCIKGQKGTAGRKGEPGVGVSGRRGPPGPQGLPGAPAVIIGGAQSQKQAAAAAASTSKKKVI